MIEDTSWNKKNYYRDQSIVKGTTVRSIIEIFEQSKSLNLYAVIDILTRELADIEKWRTKCIEILDTKKNKCIEFKVAESLYNEGTENPLLHYIYENLSEFEYNQNSCPK